MTATIALLFGRKYYQSNIGGVFLDATISEEHEYNSRVTQFPVENGTVISDHIINDPIRLSISGIVSDSPIRFLSFFNRSTDAFNRLIRIHELKERITVVTGIKIYENMVMTSLNVPREVGTGQALNFSMEFQQILLASSVTLNLFQNNPFNQIENTIPRSQVADSEKYPVIQNDPPLSLKDQASSGVNIGVQNLQAIPPSMTPNILNNLPLLRGFL